MHTIVRKRNLWEEYINKSYRILLNYESMFWFDINTKEKTIYQRNILSDSDVNLTDIILNNEKADNDNSIEILYILFGSDLKNFTLKCFNEESILYEEFCNFLSRFSMLEVFYEEGI